MELFDLVTGNFPNFPRSFVLALLLCVEASPPR